MPSSPTPPSPPSGEASNSRQPPSPAAAEAALIALYAWAQGRLLTGVWAILAGTPHTLQGVQAAMAPMRRLVQQVQASLQVRTAPLVQAMVEGYAAKAEADATRQVGEELRPEGADDSPPSDRSAPGTHPGLPGTHPGSAHGSPPPEPPGGHLATRDDDFFNLSMPHGERAAAAIRAELQHTLGAASERITRLPDDVYKAIAPHGAIAQVLDNGLTSRQSQALAWRAFVDQGVTGFTDRAGRRWQLSSYVEMAVRTAAMRAYNDSHLQRMRVLGVKFFQVPPHTTACPLCLPWEGQLLADGVQPDPGVPVAGTVAEATAAGLFHPNCRHALSAWFPGSSDPPPPPRVWDDTADRQWRDTQRQRALERAIRRAKQRQALALDPAVQADAGRQVRAAQAAIREHLAGKAHLSRDSDREQIALGYARTR